MDSVNREADKDPVNEELPKPPTTLQNVWIFLKQFLKTFYPRLLMLTVFIIAMLSGNAIGLIYSFTTIVSLVIEQRHNWSYVYISYILISFLSIGSEIYFLIEHNPDEDLADITSWFGLSLIFGKIAIDAFVTNLIILLLSIFGMLISLWPDITISKEEYEQMSEKYKSILHKKHQKAPNPVSEPSPDQSEHEEDPQLKKDFQYIKARYYYKKFDEAVEHLYHVHGYELSLFFLLIVAFVRLNIMSVFYVMVSSYFSFSSKYFYNQEKYGENLSKLRWKWRIVYTILALDLMRQYFFLTWFPLSWNIPRVAEDEDFGCNQDARRAFSQIYPFSYTNDYNKCKTNWREWLSLDNFSSGELITNFINLFMFINYDKYFTAYVSFHPEKHSPGDEKDFTAPRKKSFVDELKFFYYCYFFFIPLFVLIMIGVKDNITGQTDLLSCLYLFGGLYLMYNYRMLIKKRNRLWGIIEIANNMILLIIVAFQVPFIPCPLALPGRYYYSPFECIILQTTYNTKHLNILNQINNPVIWYNLIDIIGINKVSQLSFETSYKEIFMILFYFFGFIQRKIWSHGYINTYVIPYYEKKDRYNYEIGAVYVEQIHLNRRLTQKELLFDSEVEQSHERKLDVKLKTWEKLFKINFQVEEAHEDLEETSDEISRKDKAIGFLEKIIPVLPEVKYLGIDSLVNIVERCNYQKDKVLEELPPEIEKIKKKLVTGIRENLVVNLPRSGVESGSSSSKPGTSPQRSEEEEEKKEQEQGQETQKEGRSEVIELEKQEGDSAEDSPVSPVKFSAGGFFLQEVPRKSEIDERKKKSILYKVKEFLVEFSRESSFICDKRVFATADDDLFSVVVQLIFMHVEKIAFLIFLLNHLNNVSLVSLVYPLSILFYGAVEYPVATRGFWRFMIIYSIVIIILKFLYQLPFFCGSPPFSFNNIFDLESYNCSTYPREQWFLPFRIDYILGIRKFTGESSYPNNQGLFGGIIWDLLSLFWLLGIRAMLDSRGIWNHMNIYKSFSFVPQLNKMPKDKVDKYRTNSLRESSRMSQGSEQSPSRVPENSSFPNRSMDLKSILRNMFAFNPFAKGSSVLRKPGYDYYKYLAPISLVILLYFLFFFSRMVGSSNTVGQDITNSQFSGGVVIAVAIIIIIMIFERGLYVTRENFYQTQIHVDSLVLEEGDLIAGEYVDQVILSKNFFYRIVMHYVMVVFVNVFFFVIMLNAVGQEEINNYGSIAFGYILCSIYLFISALQVKYGYPLEVQTGFFTSSDEITTLIFKVYRAIPFLYEIAAILDWSVTKTALDLFAWMKLEDAEANLYIVKSQMESRKDHKPGEARPTIDKILFGFCLGFLLVFLILFPILLFSTLNPAQQFNNVIAGEIDVQLTALGQNVNNVMTIYEVKNVEIQSVAEEEFEYLKGVNSILESYEIDQVQKIRIPTFSEQEWLISPPALQLLKTYLDDDTVDVYVSISWSFSRPGPADSQVTSGSNSKLLSFENQQDILIMLETTGQRTSTFLLDMFPKFLGLSKTAYTQLLGARDYTKEGYTFSTDAELSYVNDVDGRYWTLERSDIAGDIQEPVFDNDRSIYIIVASDKVIASILSSLGSLGLVGFYVTVVLAIGKLVRGLFDRVSQRVIYEEMSRPDDLIELCRSKNISNDCYNSYSVELSKKTGKFT